MDTNLLIDSVDRYSSINRILPNEVDLLCRGHPFQCNEEMRLEELSWSVLHAGSIRKYRAIPSSNCSPFARLV